MLWFNEYFRADSGEPVDLSIGLSCKEAAIHRGKVVCVINGYCAFWVSCKREGDKEMPVRQEYFGVTYDLRGVPTWRNPVTSQPKKV